MNPDGGGRIALTDITDPPAPPSGRVARVDDNPTLFPDACALLVPEREDSPWITMGAPGQAVQGLLWRADRDGLYRLRAEGFDNRALTRFSYLPAFPCAFPRPDAGQGPCDGVFRQGRVGISFGIGANPYPLSPENSPHTQSVLNQSPVRLTPSLAAKAVPVYHWLFILLEV
jgi:hypothetical protein